MSTTTRRVFPGGGSALADLAENKSGASGMIKSEAARWSEVIRNAAAITLTAH